MANIDNFHILPEQEDLFFKACTLRNGWWGSKIDKKKIIYRKRNFENLVEQSTFPDIAEAWNKLSPYKKDKWESAAQWANMNGWSLFSKDMAYRIANGIGGIGEANIYWQFMVGKLTIEAPATEIKIKQNISLGQIRQLELSINYIAKLTAFASPNWCDLYLYFDFYDYDGWYQYSENLYLDGGDMWYFSGDYYDWGADNLRNMFLQFEIHNMRGALYVDGISLIGNNINLVNDWQCDNIQSSWSAVNVPTGAKFESVYWRNLFYNE